MIYIHHFETGDNKRTFSGSKYFIHRYILQGYN